MKRKIMAAVAFLLVLCMAFFAVDYFRCMDLKKPVFTVARTVDDGGSGTYYGLGYRIEVRGHLDAEYGFVVESAEVWLFGLILVGAAIT